MSNTIFIELLAGFTAISAVAVEAIKNLVGEKPDGFYNIVAFIVSLIVGGIGTAVYYQLGGLPFDVNNIICAVLMGLGTGITSQVAYDKVKDAITSTIIK